MLKNQVAAVGLKQAGAQRLIVAQFGLLHVVTIPAFLVFGAVLSKRELGGAGAWSTILALFAAGSLVGGLVGLRLTVRRPLLVASLWNAFVALPVALLALRTGWAPIAAGAFVAGVGGAVFGVLWETSLQRAIPPEALSRVSASTIARCRSTFSPSWTRANA